MPTLRKLAFAVADTKRNWLFGSGLRRSYKGWRCKNHLKALRDEIAEVCNALFIPPPLPQPLSTPAGAERGA